MRSDEKTLDKFDEGQLAALKSGNLEKRARGLPDWEVVDFVRVHPNKFPDVSDDPNQPVSEAAPGAPAPAPAKPARLDQRE